jgi:hypothetical protein
LIYFILTGCFGALAWILFIFTFDLKPVPAKKKIEGETRNTESLLKGEHAIAASFEQH